MTGRPWAAATLLVAATLVANGATEPPPLIVASKSFTEGVILGEIATHLLRGAGVPVKHRRELGGTRILFNALEQGEIDIYAEYTGTLTQEILAELELQTFEQIAGELRRRGLLMTRPLGFDNSYALGMDPETAERLAIRSISDLADHPDLRLGLGNEFMDRGDGWPSLRRHYNLPQRDVRGLDHDLAYRALDAGRIDVMDLYTTDAEIDYYGLRVLDDDLAFFRTYEAVFLYRADVGERYPAAAQALRRAEGSLDEAQMQRLNARVKIDGESDDRVTAEFVRREFGVEAQATRGGLAQRLWQRTLEHLLLVGLAMAGGILTAVPLGVVAAKSPRAGRAILGIVGVIQTIPALALLVFMIPLLGIYEPPAIVALFLYSLLPMVRNTHTGLTGIAPSVIESAHALGLSARTRLLKIELPLASPSILAGIKTSTVITIGFATLGALIGAGGYGQPIFTGIRLDDTSLILEGALPSAGMALAAQWLFDAGERRIIPRGLRLKKQA